MGNRNILLNSAERIRAHLMNPEEFKTGASLYADRRKNLESVYEILCECVDRLGEILGSTHVRGRSLEDEKSAPVSREEFDALLSCLKNIESRRQFNHPEEVKVSTTPIQSASSIRSRDLSSGQCRSIIHRYARNLSAAVNHPFTNPIAKEFASVMWAYFNFRFIEYGKFQNIRYNIHDVGKFVSKFFLVYIDYHCQGSTDYFLSIVRKFVDSEVPNGSTYPLPYDIGNVEISDFGDDTLKVASEVWDELMGSPYYNLRSGWTKNPVMKDAFLDLDIMNYVHRVSGRTTYSEGDVAAL